MRMSEDSYNKMNALAGKCFNANAIIDNLAYNLFYYYYNEIGEIIHLKVAHIMPEWADLITDKMLELSARPIRVDINGYQEDYPNVKDIFDVLNNTLVSILEDTRNLVSSSDIAGDDEVRIFAENFLEIVSPYVKQSEEWQNACNSIGSDVLNHHMKEHTHFIAL